MCSASGAEGNVLTQPKDPMAAGAGLKAITERFEGRVPSADEPIRAFLIRDMGFSKQGAEECISALRTSMKQVSDLPLRIAVGQH